MIQRRRQAPKVQPDGAKVQPNGAKVQPDGYFNEKLMLMCYAVHISGADILEQSSFGAGICRHLFYSMKAVHAFDSVGLWPLVLPFSPNNGKKPPDRQQLRRLPCRDCFLSVSGLSVSIWFVGVNSRYLENANTDGYIIQ